jgi:hypothetical protein
MLFLVKKLINSLDYVILNKENYVSNFLKKIIVFLISFMVILFILKNKLIK